MDFAIQNSGTLLTGTIDPVTTGVLGIVLGGMGMFFGMIALIISIFMAIACWKMFKKAGKPGWGIFVPFYNMYLMFKIGGRPGRWFLRALIPPVFFVLAILLNFDIAKRFGRHRTFGLGLWLVPIVFIPIVAFDPAITYIPKQ